MFKWSSGEEQRTPKSQATLNRYEAFPTTIFGLMLLINPGMVGVIDTRRVMAALQFYVHERPYLRSDLK